MSRILRGKLVLATHNEGKAAEFARLFAPYGVEVAAAGAFGLVAPPETGETFEQNARLKAESAMRASGLPALADDSGLAVAALGGAPGVYSADWALHAGGRDYLRAMRRIWQALQENDAEPPHRAAFCCCLCAVWPDGESATVMGRAEGQITWPPRGEAGFGYDPIFQPDAGDGRSFAEMTQGEKTAISHRADAFARFAAAHLEPAS